MKPNPLTGAEQDVLWCLFMHGPTEDGDVPSKAGRSDLVDRGFAARHEGFNWLTDEGTRTCIEIGFGPRKYKRQRELAEARRR